MRFSFQGFFYYRSLPSALKGIKTDSQAPPKIFVRTNKKGRKMGESQKIEQISD
jgi:hypothetical protein